MSDPAASTNKKEWGVRSLRSGFGEQVRRHNVAAYSHSRSVKFPLDFTNWSMQSLTTNALIL